MIVNSDPLTEAFWRMVPDPDDVADLAEHFARQETDSGCPGSVLAAYLADVVMTTAHLHAAECRNRRCHTCAGLATAMQGVAAHNRLHGDQIAGEEHHP